MQCDCGGYEFKPIEAGATMMTYVNMVDPKGSIPARVVRATAPQRAMVVARLSRLL